MFQLVLFQPEIPPNTGNVIRLCANTGTRLHLVRPLGFSLEDRYLARAGMDYRDIAAISIHDNWDACLEALGACRLYFATTHGETRHDAPRYRAGDTFVLGPEGSGLPRRMLDGADPGQRVRLPMRPGNRSLNLGNSAAVLIYEAWRQHGFAGGA